MLPLMCRLCVRPLGATARLSSSASASAPSPSPSPSVGANTAATSATLSENPTNARAGTAKPPGAFRLVSGRELPEGSMQISYATWGDPRNPAVLVCPSMSQSAFAADVPAAKATGWWREVVGQGSRFGIDTDKYFVISGAPLGAPFGTTSPLTVNPVTNDRWGVDFPQITPADMAACQALLLDDLGVDRVLAVVGGSMGGMQVLQFAAMFPDRYDRFMAVAATGQTPPSTVALRSVQRSAVRMDPAFNSGRYPVGKGPSQGMAVARKFGTIGYRSRDEFDNRFNWLPDPEVTLDSRDSGDEAAGILGTAAFEVERYLEYQAKKFTSVVNYDANCYLLLSQAMDRMNLGAGFSSFEEGVRRIPAGKEALLLSYDTDTLTPARDMEHLASLLGEIGAHVYYEELKSKYGHDAFLIHREAAPINFRVKAFLENTNALPDRVDANIEAHGVHRVRQVVRDLHEH